MTEQHPDFQAEQAHLKMTLSEMEQIMAELNADIDDRLIRAQKSLSQKDQVSAYIHTMLRSDNAKRIDDISLAKSSPYFGRVDFREDEAPDFDSFYIGRYKIAKLSIQETKDILVFDWRDPVSTIFYEGYGGRASYDVLGRYHYQGDVRLKRQYKIEDGILKMIVDNYIMEQILSRQKEALLADPMLIDRLQQGATDKLKDIVTSIQAEQNKIIREPLNQVTVIQGVAGSGKTTIGLHRLSYLLYNEKLNAQKLIVIAPNRIFLDYISELLPEIDAANVPQMVWDDLVSQITQTKYTIAINCLLELILSGGSKEHIRLLEDTAQLKGSFDFTKVLDAYLEQKIQKFCMKLADISLFDGQLKISTAEQLDKVMEDIKVPYNERIRALIHYITFRVNNYIDIAEARKGKKGSHEPLTECREEATNFLDSYFKRWKSITPLTAYHEIFSSKAYFKAVKDKRYDFDAIRAHSLSILDAGEVEREDLAPLAYLAYLIDGWRHVEKFDHIVIDEAQDLNALEFAILKRLSTNGSFTIMGDLSQGIHSYRSISSWNILLKEIFADSRTAYREITYSYRSAKEIIDVSNRVMPQGHTRATGVYEIGHKPTTEKILSPEHGINRIIERLQVFLAQGTKSIGIITKQEKDAVALHATLQTDAKIHGLNQPIHLVSGEIASYQGGISVLPILLAKGLEFDAVIVWNASESEFTADPFNARLLYVALSRAMHSLHIMYQGNLTPLLRKKPRKSN
ncbi:MAG: Helicase superfamily 1 UvrD-related protein [Firmicutes bacterium]|nr:Helicase superfamily 1 UvrD-related protein [Bacillota bacterium]